MFCHGNGPDHCCWTSEGLCPFLEENTVPGRRWACGLYRKLGSWEAVYADPRYQSSAVATWFAEILPGLGCGGWPQDIPAAMMSVSGKCCWQEVTDGDMGP